MNAGERTEEGKESCSKWVLAIIGGCRGGRWCLDADKSLLVNLQGGQKVKSV